MVRFSRGPPVRLSFRPVSADESNTMMNPGAQTYLRTKVMTASPAELRLMLIDGAIRFAEQCRAGLADRDFEQAYEGSRQCRAILTELLSGLKPEHDPVLAQRLNSLYTFMISKLMEGMSERSPACIAEVVQLLKFERETWEMVLAQMAATADAADHADATAATDQDPGVRSTEGLHLAG